MNSKTTYYLRLIGIPVIAALILRFVFNVDRWDEIWAIMSVSFFFGLPYLTGVLTIYLSREESIKSKAYRIIYPWIPIFAFFVITLLFSLEGWACWLMILPLFMAIASLGGLTAGYFRLKKSRNVDKLQISLALLLPFLAAPVENAIGPTLSVFEAYTYIDIEGPKEKIWSNVTKVPAIEESEDSGKLNKFLGIPRPVKAELNYEGVNAERKAIFSGGVVFIETVTHYQHQVFMQFSIKPNTAEIPSTTFDEHVLIGGEYFDVLNGSYRLEELSAGMYRLHLWSEFKLNTTFNFYSGLWATWIMKDIQNNILRVVKMRSEKKEMI